MENMFKNKTSSRMANMFNSNVLTNVANVFGNRAAKPRRPSSLLNEDLEVFEELFQDHTPDATDAGDENVHDKLGPHNASDHGGLCLTVSKAINELETRQKRFAAELQDNMERFKIQGSHTTLHTEEELEGLKNDIRNADDEIAFCQRQLLALEEVKEMEKKNDLLRKEVKDRDAKIQKLEAQINDKSHSPTHTFTALERENERLRQEIEERREEKEELVSMVAHSRGRELGYQQRIQGLMKNLKDADDTLSRYIRALQKEAMDAGRLEGRHRQG